MIKLNKNIKYLIFILIVFSCDDQGDLINNSDECIDESACNTGAKEDCVYAEEYYDCDGNILYSAVQNIFDSNCTQCHGTSGGLNLSSYTDLMNNDVIVPGDHQSSYLWQRVEDGSMPPSSDNLTSEEVDLIAAWIDEGAVQ